jgi:hypothetical protein
MDPDASHINEEVHQTRQRIDVRPSRDRERSRRDERYHAHVPAGPSALGDEHDAEHIAKRGEGAQNER